MLSNKLKDNRYQSERPRKQLRHYRKSSQYLDRGRHDDQDNIPEDRFNVRKNRIRQLTETYSATSNLLLDDSTDPDYSADYSEMSSKETKGKRKKGKKGKKGKLEHVPSGDLSPKPSKTGEESPKPTENIYELNKRLSGSVKNLPENHHKSESLVSVSRTVIRSKPNGHKGSGIFSNSNLLQNLVKSNHPSKQFSPVLKSHDAACSVPGDIDTIVKKASNSGFPAGSTHSLDNVSKIPANRTPSSYFRNEISTQTDGPVYSLPDPPNYITATSRKTSKLTTVPDSYESANQRVAVGARPPYLDNAPDMEKCQQMGCIPPPNRDLQAKKFPNAKNKYICYKISVPSSDNTFTDASVQKQVPQKNLVFDHPSNTYASHAPPQWGAQTYHDGGGKGQFEGPNSANMYVDDVSSGEVRDLNYERKQYRKTSVSNSETNAAKLPSYEHRQRSKVDSSEQPRKSVGLIRRDTIDRNKLPVLKDGGSQYDRKSTMHEVGASKSCDSVKSLKDWNTMVARDFEHLLALYQNFKSMSAQWKGTDEGTNVEQVGKERYYREEDHNIDTNEAFYMDILDDPDNKMEGPGDKTTMIIATDDECQTTVNTEDGYKPESKLSKGIHNSVEYLKLYRICCAAKAASEADIKTPGIDNKGYVEDGFVDYLQRHREFDVRKLINMCGIQLVSVDEDILSNLNNYLQLYSDYLTQKNGCNGACKETEQYPYIENTFKCYVQLYYVFSAAKLLSEEGQEIPGVDKNGFLDDDFLDYLQQFRDFSVRKVINDCSFSTPSAFIANNVSHYIQEYLRLYDEYQAYLNARHNQIPDHNTQRQSVNGHQDPRCVYPAKVPEVAAHRNGYQKSLNKGSYQHMQNGALLRNPCDIQAYKDVCCSSCQVEDFDLLVLNEANRTSQRNMQEKKSK